MAAAGAGRTDAARPDLGAAILTGIFLASAMPILPQARAELQSGGRRVDPPRRARYDGSGSASRAGIETDGTGDRPRGRAASRSTAVTR
ncbi:hypothetical protein SAMN02799643_03618 [Methylobacterium sp. UNCCL125]|jgi:hypothetical protein|nr:hypothetical protein SAMN02799643_03618 [Methylobacterium sp. UNCCL125]